jgi:antibiotic biosynthesis monooxygenase (ABM) superfamily enzyme
MNKLRRWLQSFRKFLSAVWYFCPLYFIIGGWMLFIVVLTLIHLSGYLTVNQFAIVMLAGMVALCCFLGGFMMPEQGELKT